MIKHWYNRARINWKILWRMSPEVFHLIRAIKTEVAIYRAKKRTENFNSLLLWNEIVG